MNFNLLAFQRFVCLHCGYTWEYTGIERQLTTLRYFNLKIKRIVVENIIYIYIYICIYH